MMDDDTLRRSRRIHEALEVNLDLRDGELLGVWLVIYETVRLDGGAPAVGHHYGPEVIPAWRALGLLDWQREAIVGAVGPDDELEDELDEEEA
jgi:hypothetical protein